MNTRTKAVLEGEPQNRSHSTVCRRFCVYLCVCDSCAAAAAVITVIPHTEKALHNTFDKDGKRKSDESCGM